MISRRGTMAVPKAVALLILIIATTSATNIPLAASSSSPVVGQRKNTSANTRPPNNNNNNNNNNSRWLTYACNSKNNGSGRRRNLLHRILTHPCTSQRKTSTTNDIYNKNTTRGSNTFVNVTLGIIAGILSLLGMLFFIDRETFTQITGVKELPYYCNPCTKPSITGDDDDDNGDAYTNATDDESGGGPTPYEKDAYLTTETREYLRDKHDKEVEKPKRILRSIFWCCFKTKQYGDGDKYNVPYASSEEEYNNIAAGNNNKEGGNFFFGNVNIFWIFVEDVRLRFCWKPTKDYNDDGRDKYDVGGLDSKDEESTVEIKIAASSYESAEPGTAPW
ncbi:hypothetical protein ACHAXR_008725 [Thalassiosira sp. AJA248-18]